MAKNPHAYLAKQRDKQIASTTRLPAYKIVAQPFSTWWNDDIQEKTEKKSKQFGKVKTEKRGWVKPGFNIDNFKKFYKYNQDV